MAAQKRSVVFVCLGNICRSATAEAVLAKLVNDRGLSDEWVIDSAGTADYHVGRNADRRVLKLLKEKGVPVSHKARQMSVLDFTEFEYILAMDDNNMRDLEDAKPKDSTAIIKLLGSYDPQGKRIIHDPYYGDDSDFVIVYDQCLRCCEAFLNEVTKS